MVNPFQSPFSAFRAPIVVSERSLQTKNKTRSIMHSPKLAIRNILLYISYYPLPSVRAASKIHILHHIKKQGHSQ